MPWTSRRFLKSSSRFSRPQENGKQRSSQTFTISRRDSNRRLRPIPPGASTKADSFHRTKRNNKPPNVTLLKRSEGLIKECPGIGHPTSHEVWAGFAACCCRCHSTSTPKPSKQWQHPIISSKSVVGIWKRKPRRQRSSGRSGCKTPAARTLTPPTLTSRHRKVRPKPRQRAARHLPNPLRSWPPPPSSGSPDSRSRTHPPRRGSKAPRTRREAIKRPLIRGWRSDHVGTDTLD